MLWKPPCRPARNEVGRPPGMEKPPKSLVRQRRDPPWRVTQDATADQRQFQSLDPHAQPCVGLARHARRTRWDGIDNRPRAAETLPEPVGLQVGPRLRAPTLALIDWASAADPAAIAAEPLEQPNYPSIAMGAVQPGPEAAVVASCPRYPDRLWDRLITKLDQDPIPRHTHRRDAGPSERRPKGDPVAREQPDTVKLAHINRVVGQLLDR